MNKILHKLFILMIASILPSVLLGNPINFPRTKAFSKATLDAVRAKAPSLLRVTRAIQAKIRKPKTTSTGPTTKAIQAAAKTANRPATRTNLTISPRVPFLWGFSAADMLFERKNASKSEAFKIFLTEMPNLFFQRHNTPFLLRKKQVEEADQFYKQFLKGRNIYGEFDAVDIPIFDTVLADAHIKWAEVLYAFTGLSLLRQPGAGQAIVDAVLRAPKPNQLLTDYVAIHCLLLLEDWPALQRLINARSNAGYGSFIELREYISNVVPDAPISFPKKIINEDYYNGPYHYPTVQQSFQLMKELYSEGWEWWKIDDFAHYIRGEKNETYFLWNTYPLSSFATGKRHEFGMGDVRDNYEKGKIFLEANLKYGAFRGLMDNFETYGIHAEDMVGKNQNVFLQCISYEDGITANMAKIRSKLHRPRIIP